MMAEWAAVLGGGPGDARELTVGWEAERRAPGWWGMVATVATEASLFAYLVFSYFYLGSLAPERWPPVGPPELRLVLPNTFILLASSGTAWWAERAIRRGDAARLRLGIAATLLLGIVFLVIQGIEFSRKSFAPTDHAYGSLFFTITGFHGAHVFVGLLMLATVLLWAFLDRFDERRHLAVTNVTLYWHFVDAVWLVVFTSLYLLPRLG